MSEEQPQQQPRFTMGYWGIRGIAQPIRTLLWYCGQEDFEDKRYNKASKEEWFEKDKPVLSADLDFPNLPYLIDRSSGVKLTQAVAIMHYIAAALKPEIATAPAEYKPVEMMLREQLIDFRNKLVRTCYNSTKQEEVDAYVGSTLKVALEEFEKWLSKKGKDGPFLFGPLHYLDFYLAEHLQQCQVLFEGCTSSFPAVEAYIGAFHALPGVAAFGESTHHLNHPVNNINAFVRGEAPKNA